MQIELLFTLLYGFILMYELREKLSLALVSSGQGLFNELQTTLFNIIPHQHSKDKPMNASVVYRSENKKNFTIVNNRILRSPNLSLKAIGLMCKILSLPDNWKYSVAGLTSICKEGKQAIKTALDELEKWGYLEMTMLTPDQTKSGRIEYVYTFYEHSDKDVLGENITDSSIYYGSDKEQRANCDTYQDIVKQDTEKQPLVFQNAETQFSDNPTQSNIKDKITKNKLLNDEISINQSMSSTKYVEKSSDRSMDGYSNELEGYTELVKDNINYCDFVEWIEDDEEAEEIVLMIARQICSRKPTECICGQEYPREIVKSAMLKVDISTLEDAVESVSHAENVRNFEKYLISTLFNEVNTHRFKEDFEAKSADYAFNRDFGEHAV